MKINFKLVALATTSLLFSSTLYAQTEAPTQPAAPSTATTTNPDKMKTLFSASKVSGCKINYIGAYFSPEMQYGSVASAMTPLAGGSAMWLINKKLGLGVAGYGTADNSFTPSSIGKTLQVGYGGGVIEYTFNPNSVFHISMPLLIGGGMAGNNLGLGFEGRKGRSHNNETDTKNNGRGSTFGIIQPGINLELNVFRFVKIFAGASYRIAVGVTNPTATTANPTPLLLTNSQLSGLNFSVGSKWGIFDFNTKNFSKIHLRRKRNRG